MFDEADRFYRQLARCDGNVATLIARDCRRRQYLRRLMVVVILSSGGFASIAIGEYVGVAINSVEVAMALGIVLPLLFAIVVAPKLRRFILD